jgi:hypothetical protein
MLSGGIITEPEKPEKGYTGTPFPHGIIGVIHDRNGILYYKVKKQSGEEDSSWK